MAQSNPFKHSFVLFLFTALVIVIAITLAENNTTDAENAIDADNATDAENVTDADNAAVAAVMPSATTDGMTCVANNLTNEADTQRMEKLEKEQEYVDILNEAQNYWTAVVHENFALMDEEMLRNMVGSLETPRYNANGSLASQLHDNKTQQQKKSATELPSKFDARKKWPECADFIGMVTNQGYDGSKACGSCWAISAAAVLTDRICIERLKKGIHSYTTNASLFVSTLDTLESQNCNCAPGYPNLAWKWFADTGVVTGTNYSMHLGCKPYIYPPESNLPKKPSGCRKQCDKQLPFNYREGRVFKLKDAPTHWSGMDENREEEMMREIMTNGPIQISVNAYDDIYNYGESSNRINVYVHTVVKGTNSVYEHKNDTKPIGGHAMKLIGWGEESTDKGELVKYWLGVNSWGTNWGLNGLFKWRRGTDECSIESSSVDFGTPDV